jgi:hypothetical protein
MKKITVLLLMATTFAYITNAQTAKSGILQKDFYGSFSGNDWEDFLAGNRAADFEKKSNIKLATYLSKQVLPFVTSELKESSIASAVANSTVVDFPAGVQVQTSDAAGNWITRNVYPNERGFLHTQTGICWLSFQCGNLVSNKFNEKTTSSNGTYASTKSTTTPKAAEGLSVTVNTISKEGSELSWNTGYAVYSMGRNDRQTDFLVDATLYKNIQDAKQCCGVSTSSQVQTISYAQPSMVTYAQAAPVQQQAQNSNIYVRNRPNVLDYINTAANVTSTVFSGINTFRGVRLEGNRNLISNSGYSNTWGGNNNGGGGRNVFQDSNQLISSNTGGGNSTVSYGGNTNTW